MQIRSRSTCVLPLALLALAGPSVVRADVTGSILGVVHDKTQAVVAGAQIVATNAENNLTRDTVSGSDGSYRLLALPAGTYKVTATAAGFQQFVTTDIDVKVNDQLRIDITLEVGSVQQAVEVTANAVQVETASTQLGDVIESKKMLALPLNGRSYLDLLGLQAGVAPASAGTIGGDRPVSGYISNAGNVSVNGQRETANAFLVNGGDVSEGRDLGAGLVPNLDSVEEFRLITNSFDAEYGKFSGAVMNAITKSGTNSFHGDVFEFVRNNDLDARGFFDPSIAELRRNQFGYTAGGPAWKNRLFWFTDYQGTRQVQGASTGIVQLPTPSMRAGNFDPASLTGVVDGPYWAQVLSQRLGYGVSVNEPYSFAGCTLTSNCVFPGGVIPQRAYDKAAVGTLPYIPLPNLNPSTGLYANDSQKNTVNDDKIGERVDFVNQTTGNWSWYYHYDNSNVYNALPAASVPGFPGITPTRAQQIVMSNTKTLGPSAVNEARVSFFRTSTITNKPAGSFANLSDLGFDTGLGSLGIVPSGPAGFPQTVPPLYFINFSIGVNTLTTGQPDNTWMLTDGFSKIMGTHALKVGGEFRYLQINERNVCAPNGDFTFDGSVTGVDFADYLLGAPTASGGYNQCSMQFLDSRTRYGGAYAQDSWKVKPNLTLNLGVRWEVSMPWYDTQGKIETIVPGEQSTQFPTAPKGWVVPGDPGIPSTLSPTRYNNFAPRLGLAYSPGFTDGILHKIFGGPGKSSIRASYGIYYTSIEDLNLFYEVGDAPFGLYWTSPVAVLMEEPWLDRQTGQSLGQRFPFTFPIPGSPANQTLNYAQFEPLSGSPGYKPSNKLPYAEHMNLSIQRELSRSTVLTLAYVGTQGHQLISQYDANPGTPALCMQLNAEGATPTCGPNGEQTTYTLPNGTHVLGTRLNLLTPAYGGVLEPAFGSGNSYTANIANSNYNAGEITVERKAADVTFLAAYTFSKGIDDSSGFGDWVNFSNYRLSRSLSAYDVTHNFVASYNWTVPFDRAFGTLPKRLTQGWNMTGISRFSTGFPISIRQSGDVSLFGSGSTDVPDVISKVITQDPRNAGPNGPNTYFLPSSFISGPVGGFGDASRRFFHGPGIINTDFGLSKRIPITESMAVELRGEFFNIFNHANFNNPNGNFTSSQFGVVTSARDPRIGQVSAKFFW
jgi:hypothetical protein